MTSPRPVPATFTANKIDERRVPFILADLRRCRRNIAYEGPSQGWPLVCAADTFEEVTRENWHTMDYIWVSAKIPKTAQGYLRALPFQGDRFYHVCAVSMLLNRGWSFYDLGVGLRASGRLEQNVFREALDKIEKCGMDEEMRKRGVNSWIGTLMIQNDFRYKVFTGSEGMAVPFQGRILRKPAPGGFDHCCRQEIASLTSYRPIYQYILDRELVEVATLVRRFLEHGVRSVIQCRVDGVVACLPKKEHKRAMELNEETWPCGVRKLKVEKIYANHRTLIPAHHVFIRFVTLSLIFKTKT